MEENSEQEIEKKIHNKNIKPQINLRESIKLLHIIKKIFSCLKENSKLNLIIYNKRFQTKLGIDIEYYKTVNGRVKSLDTNDYGKEYKLNTDILVFEGGYRKGKEYYDDNKVKFKGAFANGKRNGFGKEYYNNGL